MMDPLIVRAPQEEEDVELQQVKLSIRKRYNKEWNNFYRSALFTFVMLFIVFVGLVLTFFVFKPAPTITPTQLYSGQDDVAPIDAVFQEHVLPEKLVQDQVQSWISQLTLKEKCELLRGSVETHGYTGYVPGVPRLGIPSLRMNDGPQGFRGPKKTSTAFPCGLAMASTFWPEIVEEVAEAIGKEFIGKGSNVFLGPGMNMARIAGNGRNFEYLCGEDPLLGEEMAYSFVKGIQSQPGLIATAKHFVNNEQETDRTKINANVDIETQWNMYYRPFAAAVRAGVDSIMCSYNRINGHQACQSEATIRRDLEGKMGFQGFVMSDWFAVTATVETALAGMDVEMPIPLYYGDALRQAVESGTLPESLVDEKLKRILSTVIRRNITDTSAFNPALNVTNEKHANLARVAAASSVIMLKNENNILPLSVEKSLRILVVGDRAKDRVLSTGGGSGHVHPPYVVSPFEGLLNGGAKHNVTYLNTVDAMSASRLFYGVADVVIVVVGTSASEGLDRPSIALETNELEMINRISSLNRNVIVSVTAPGTITLPFLDTVSAVLLQFMPGQEAGNALADVIYGRVDPGGARLPVTIPNTLNETNMTKIQYPGVDYDETYAEKTQIGYRWYAANPSVVPQVAFGSGMSYASFRFLGVEFHKMNNGDYIFHIGLMNTSKRKGVIVPQIYITKFPHKALSIVAPIALVGFKRVEIDGYDVKAVSVVVKKQSISVWTKEAEDYVVFPGKYEFSVGTNSQDFWKTVHTTM